MKTLKAVAILFGGPLLGILIALLAGGLAIPHDPNFVANGSHRTAGDGILIMIFLLVSLIISISASIVLAGVVFFRKSKGQDQVLT